MLMSRKILKSPDDWTNVKAIAFELYDCDNRYVGNDIAQSAFDEYCSKHNLSGFLSPLHQPGEGKKNHRHGAIWVNDNRSSLNYGLYSFLCGISTDCPYPIAVDNSLDMRKALARYSVHITRDSVNKEQFDFRDPALIEFDIDKSDLTNIYHPVNGFIQFGNCSFVNLITLTIREKANEKSDKHQDNLKVILKYIFDNFICNYTDLMSWCLENNYLDTLCAFNSVIKNTISDMSHSKHFSNQSLDRHFVDEDHETLKEIEHIYKAQKLNVLSRSKSRAFAIKRFIIILSQFKNQIDNEDFDILVDSNNIADWYSSYPNFIHIVNSLPFNYEFKLIRPLVVSYCEFIYRSGGVVL